MHLKRLSILFTFFTFGNCVQSFGSEFDGHTKCIAHRGLSSKYLENSFESFEGAIRAGAFAVELDLRHSKDGVGFILHDADLSRTAENKEGHDCPLKTRLSDLLSKDVIEHCQLKNGETVPTLAGLFERFEKEDPHFFLEFKDRPSDQSLSIVRDWLARTKKDQTLISFSAKRLETVKEDVNVKMFSHLEFLHLAHYSSQSNKTFNGIDLRVVSRKTLADARGLGLTVGVWTKDKSSTIQKYLDLGVDYITTNRVDACLKLSQK